MRNSQQYPIGTIFRKFWEATGFTQEFEVLECGTGPYPKMRMTYGRLTPTVNRYHPGTIVNCGYEVILPKSSNFNTLYEKLNGTAQG